MKANAKRYKKEIPVKKAKISVNKAHSRNTYIEYTIKKDRNFRRLLTVICLVFIFSLSVKSYMSYNEIVKRENRLKELNDESYSLSLIRDDLNKKLEDTIDLSEIKRYAFENLGMRNADSDNIVEINVDR
ncbi:MAG: septum formation initiator [Tissierellia bacterium]|nr:septum formation initiator [Tissierellia bacterium]